MSKPHKTDMKYPIGIQTFEKVISGNYVYVDKTALVYKLVKSGEYYFISRPRRFGKSLLTTTLEAYFQGRKDLFKGLAMERLEKEWTEHPIFHLDFSGDPYVEENTLNSVINDFLMEQEELYGKRESETTFGLRFAGVVRRAYEKTGQKAVILIDEYDKPLTDVMDNLELKERNRITLQGLYGIMKKADKYIRFAFLTGVTRYGKLGIFSAANNADDISMSDDYSSICGITEEELHSYFDDEVQAFADKLSVDKEEMYLRLKRKFNGYRFSINGESVYNPYSLLGALKAKVLENKWFATGTPSFLALMLKKNIFDLSKLEDGVDATAESMSSFGNDEDNLTAALYQSGYLTIKDYDGREYYHLGFPNEEVKDGFVRYLMKEFSGRDKSELDGDIKTLRDMIEADDAQGFMAQIQMIMSQIPFENAEPKMVELHFRNMIYLMIRSTGHEVSLERPVLGGRIDIFFETERYAYIIECKRDHSAEEALAQIDEKRYAEKITASDKKIVKIGVNLSTEERNIVEWVIRGV
ncbi:MAG: ATP-binding protein [Paludibacteraceae bacterium]|nr:ATP-binding protein [Paludibacteraceae bacterium]